MGRRIAEEFKNRLPVTVEDDPLDFHPHKARQGGAADTAIGHDEPRAPSREPTPRDQPGGRDVFRSRAARTTGPSGGPARMSTKPVPAYPAPAAISPRRPQSRSGGCPLATNHDRDAAVLSFSYGHRVQNPERQLALTTGASATQ